MPTIPLIEELTTASVPAGSYLLVQFDSASQWYNASVTIAAGWLKTGGRARYTAMDQPTDGVRRKLGGLGVDTKQLETRPIRIGEDRPQLMIIDGYTTTLGQKSNEKRTIPSLKVSDLSIHYSRDFMKSPFEEVEREFLGVTDNESTLARFNDERAWIEFELTREIPAVRLSKIIEIEGIISGVHSDWVYKKLEASADGVVDFKLEEVGKRAETLMRIRSMRNVPYGSEWHQLKVDEHFEVRLEK